MTDKWSVIGIDEVGRGCWAGPLLVVAARSKKSLPSGLTDSKKLSAKKRQHYSQLLSEVCEFGEGWVKPLEIDRLGLSGAMRLGVSRALTAFKDIAEPKILMDGNINYCHESFSNVECVIRGDSVHSIISAASIYAKVERDNYMRRISELYPEYEFDKHVGYGTKKHQEMLKKHGVSQIHRLSYKPVKACL